MQDEIRSSHYFVRYNLSSRTPLQVDCLFRLYSDIQQNLRYTSVWNQNNVTLNGSVLTNCEHNYAVGMYEMFKH